MSIAPRASACAPADVEAWLAELGLVPLERADREGVTSWDLRLDGTRRAALRVTVILDPALALICWAHYAPPIGDAFRKSFRQFLRWNDFTVGRWPLFLVEIPAALVRPVRLLAQARGRRGLAHDEIVACGSRQWAGLADPLTPEQLAWARARSSPPWRLGRAARAGGRRTRLRGEIPRGRRDRAADDVVLAGRTPQTRAAPPSTPSPALQAWRSATRRPAAQTLSGSPPRAPAPGPAAATDLTRRHRRHLHRPPAARRIAVSVVITARNHTVDEDPRPLTRHLALPKDWFKVTGAKGATVGVAKTTKDAWLPRLAFPGCTAAGPRAPACSCCPRPARA
jgi:hypothetical protein